MSAVFTHFLTTGVAEKNFRRDKLEQLYTAASKYVQDSLEDASLYRTSGQIAASELKDFEKRREDHDRLFDTCHMLANLYFPELSAELATFAEHWKEFVFGTTAVSEEQLQQSGAKFIALIVFTAYKMNRPLHLKLKDWFPRRLGWFGKRR